MALESSQQYNRELYEYSQQIEEDENDEETLQQDTRTPSLPMQSDNQQKSKKKQYNTTKKTSKRKENTVEDTSDEETTDLSDLSDWIEIPWSMWSAMIGWMIWMHDLAQSTLLDNYVVSMRLMRLCYTWMTALLQM